MSDDAQDFVDTVASMPEPVANGRNRDGKFGPGNPGGPGAPKKKYFRDAFIEYLEEHPDALPEIVKTLAEAARGKEENWRGERVNHISAAQFVKETLDGKAKQELEVHGPEDGPMVIKIVHEDMGQ